MPSNLNKSKTRRNYRVGGNSNTNRTLSNIKSSLHKVSQKIIRAQNNLSYRLHPTPRNLNKYKSKRNLSKN